MKSIRYALVALSFQLVCWQFSQGQSYKPFPLEDGVQWRELYLCVESLDPGCMEFYIQEYNIVGDTVINSISYKKIINKAYPFILDWDSPNCCERGMYMYWYFGGNKMAIRQDTSLRTVYMYDYNSNTEGLLYDFSLNVNDTLFSQITCSAEPCELQTFDVVQNIDSVLVDSNYHRRWNFACTAPIIEGVGSEKDFPGTLGWYGTLICAKTLNYTYLNYSVLWWLDSTFVENACNVIASSEFKSPERTFLKLFPNPVGEQLEIKSTFSSLNNSEVVIYNASGQRVMKCFATEGNNGTFKIDVQALSPGVYWIEVASNENIFRSNFLKK